MQVLKEVRIVFEGDVDSNDVTFAEHSDEYLQLSQSGDTIIIPKKDAGAFADELVAWIATGGRYDKAA